MPDQISMFAELKLLLFSVSGSISIVLLVLFLSSQRIIGFSWVYNDLGEGLLLLFLHRFSIVALILFRKFPISDFSNHWLFIWRLEIIQIKLFNEMRKKREMINDLIPFFSFHQDRQFLAGKIFRKIIMYNIHSLCYCFVLGPKKIN